MNVMDEMQRKFFISKLEQLGATRVREKLDGLGGFDIFEAPIARAWLKEKESEIDKESLKLTREANTILRSAKNASWWAMVIAIISVVISLVAIFKD